MKKALFFLIVFSTIGKAQINLVKDNIIATQFMPYKNEMYFIGSDAVDSYPRQNLGLWKTDGTTEGTLLIAQISISSPESQSNFFYAEAGGYLYFCDGGQLFRTDGTSEGTLSVANFFNINTYVIPVDLNGLLIFCVVDNDGEELWKSDGTIEGTSKIIDFVEGPMSGIFSLYNKNLVIQNGYVYFLGGQTIPNRPALLCRTNGTAQGTEIVPFGGLANGFGGIKQLGNKLIYCASIDYNHICGPVDQKYVIMQIENGVASILHDVIPYYIDNNDCGPYYSYEFFWTGNFWLAGDNLYFESRYYADPQRDAGIPTLVKTNGMFLETVKLYPDINQVGLSLERGFWHAITISSTPFQNIFYFPARIDGNTGYELWRSDGTNAGTYLLKDINPGVESSKPLDFRSINGITYFSVFDGQKRKLYQTDGSQLGTLEVLDSNNLLNEINSSSTDGYLDNNYFSNILGNTLFFSGTTTSNTKAIFSITKDCSENFSFKSGDWDKSTSWNCGHTPFASENVKIAPGHVVSITSNVEVKNIEILGTLNFNNFQLKLNGN